MSFSVRWLRMREPFDHRARSEGALEPIRAHLGPRSEPLRVLALGAGLGSGLRWLAPRLQGEQAWILVDQDPALLELAPATRHMPPSDRIQARALQADIRDLDALPDEVDLVVCQALLDLASHAWLAALAEWLARRQLPLLAALTVDGRVHWSPAHPLDEEVQAAFRIHQLGDRGFGPSPGWRAAEELADHLRMRGYKTGLAPADWQIDPADQAMLTEMVRGTAQAAREVHPAPERVVRWEAARLQAVARGEVGLRVGHQDLWGIPVSDRRADPG